MNLQVDLDQIEAQVQQARLELVRLSARINGLEAERAALIAALDTPSVPAPAGVDLAAMTKDRAIVEVLRARAEPMRINQIVEGLKAVGRPNETYNGISVYLDTLLNQHRVTRVARGLYAAVEQ